MDDRAAWKLAYEDGLSDEDVESEAQKHSKGFIYVFVLFMDISVFVFNINIKSAANLQKISHICKFFYHFYHFSKNFTPLSVHIRRNTLPFTVHLPY